MTDDSPQRPTAKDLIANAMAAQMLHGAVRTVDAMNLEPDEKSAMMICLAFTLLLRTTRALRVPDASVLEMLTDGMQRNPQDPEASAVQRATEH